MPYLLWHSIGLRERRQVRKVLHRRRPSLLPSPSSGDDGRCRRGDPRAELLERHQRLLEGQRRRERLAKALSSSAAPGGGLALTVTKSSSAAPVGSKSPSSSSASVVGDGEEVVHGGALPVALGAEAVALVQPRVAPLPGPPRSGVQGPRQRVEGGGRGALPRGGGVVVAAAVAPVPVQRGGGGVAFGGGDAGEDFHLLELDVNQADLSRANKEWRERSRRSIGHHRQNSQ